MPEIHHLPPPALPEGWESDGRHVRRYVRNGAAVDILVVWPAEGGYRGHPAAGLSATQREAIAAVERAYCNAHIR